MTAAQPGTGRPVHVGVLECGAVMPQLARDHGTAADWFRRYLSAPLAPATFSSFATYQGALPDSADSCDVYVVTGSAASVNDPDDWIPALAAFLRTAAARRPVLGVCFGHQLLHKAFGGAVEANAEGWGIGVHQYAVVADHALVPAGLRRLALLVSHNEQVTRPAPGAEVVASSAFCPFAVTAIGPNVLTIQAHPEATKAYSRDLYDHRRERIGAARVEAALSSLAQATDERAFAAMVAGFLRSRLQARRPDAQAADRVRDAPLSARR